MKQIKILEMTERQLLSLEPYEVFRLLTGEEILHIFKTLNGFWSYDYVVAKRGIVGYHAKLKSERCSDGFFYSKIVLQHPNLRRIIAKTLKWKYEEIYPIKPDRVAGIPDGAYELGHDVADYWGIPVLEMVKENGKIKLVDEIDPNQLLLLVEDFCTKGTGFKEVVGEISAAQPNAMILKTELVILNRGGLKEIEVDGEKFFILAAVTHRINDWDPAECPLHKMGSESIKPKATDENWKIITSSQV